MLEILTSYFKLIKFFEIVFFKNNNYFAKQFKRSLITSTTLFLRLKSS